MRRLPFFISEAYRALRRNAAPSIAAIVTIAVTVLLVGVLVPVLRASEDKTEDVREQIALRVFLFPDPGSAEVSSLGKRIESVRHVTEVDFVSAKAALAELENRLDERDLLRAIKNNPLPASFNVLLDDPDNLESVQNALAPPNAAGKPQPISSAIDEITTAEETDQLRQVTGSVKVILLAIAILLAFSSLFLIGNTIRLSIYARRREVEVMRLVGATNWFVRWPFIIEGLVVGLVGSAIAIGILSVSKIVVVDPLADNFALIENLDTIAFAPLVVALLGGSMLIAALGSGITLRRFLRI